MSRHRIIKSAGLSIFQNLQTLDFVNKLWLDSKNSNHATLEGANAVRNTVTFDDYFLNPNSDFTWVTTFYFNTTLYQSHILLGNNDTQLRLELYYNSHIFLRVNGVLKINYAIPGTLAYGNHTIVLQRVGDTYKIYIDGVSVTSATSSDSITTDTLKIYRTGGGVVSFHHIACINDTVLDATITAWGVDTGLNVRAYCAANPTVSYFFPCSEGYGFVFDIIQAKSGVAPTWGNLINKRLYNLEFGAQRYNDGSNNILVPLLYTGLPINPTIPTFSAQETFNQDGYSLYRYGECAVTNNIALKDFSFWGNGVTMYEKTPEQIYSATENYIKQTNPNTYSIKDLKTLG